MVLRARAVPGALTDADRRLARLGARLRACDPRRARALGRMAEARLATGADRRLVGHAERARRALLRAPRIRSELARGEVVLVDGWLLARSEAALCVYLAGLASRVQA